jgi:hypothetical protein
MSGIRSRLLLLLGEGFGCCPYDQRVDGNSSVGGRILVAEETARAGPVAHP